MVGGAFIQPWPTFMYAASSVAMMLRVTEVEPERVRSSFTRGGAVLTVTPIWTDSMPGISSVGKPSACMVRPAGAEPRTVA